MKTQLERVEVLLRYYRLKGVNKEKINEIKRKLINEKSNK